MCGHLCRDSDQKSASWSVWFEYERGSLGAWLLREMTWALWRHFQFGKLSERCVCAVVIMVLQYKSSIWKQEDDPALALRRAQREGWAATILVLAEADGPTPAWRCCPGTGLAWLIPSSMMGSGELGASLYGEQVLRLTRLRLATAEHGSSKHPALMSLSSLGPCSTSSKLGETISLLTLKYLTLYSARWPSGYRPLILNCSCQVLYSLIQGQREV